MTSKTINLSPEDLEAIQRLLTTISNANRRSDDTDEISHDRFVKVARASLALRKRRAEYLHPAMLGEPAYDMLLALYVSGAENTAVSVARLGEIAGVAPSSASRWVEYLLGKDLVERQPNPHHKRASMLTLSANGKDALEGVFRNMVSAFADVAS